MKLLLNVDQAASLIAGINAPHSTITVEVNPSDIPQDVRELVMPHYRIATGSVVYDGDQDPIKRGDVGFPTVTNPEIKVLANATPQDAVAALATFARDILTRHEQLAAVKAKRYTKFLALVEAAEAVLTVEPTPVQMRAKYRDGRWIVGARADAPIYEGGENLYQFTGWTREMASLPSDLHNSGETELKVRYEKAWTHNNETLTGLDAMSLALEIPRLDALREANEKAATEKAAADKAAANAEARALYASRLESGEWTKEMSSYNERRYGAWWVAAVTFDVAKAVYDFRAGTSTATHGNAGDLTIPCVPGDVIAYGQKDMRKPANNENNILFMHENGRMESCTATEARKLQKAFLEAKVTA